ncbi:hypothetical protein ILUMI_02974, partial [Ignelater luminosus]
MQAAEDSNQSSFNPFLVDDPTPSLLLDTDSPQSERKPIKDVLEYFQKDDSIKPSENQDVTPTTSIADDTKHAHTDSNINDDIEKETSQKVVVKKSTPPPRPPPPTRTYSKSHIETNVNNSPGDPSVPTLNNPDNNIPASAGKPSDNNFPSVFTANEGVPVVTQNTAISSQLS